MSNGENQRICNVHIVAARIIFPACGRNGSVESPLSHNRLPGGVSGVVANPVFAPASQAPFSTIHVLRGEIHHSRMPDVDQDKARRESGKMNNIVVSGL